MVTGVAWPAEVGDSSELITPASGTRLVAFSIRVTEPGDDVQSGEFQSASNVLSLAIDVGGTPTPIDLTSLDNEIGSRVFGPQQVTGAVNYVAAVPEHATNVDLVATDDGFSQSFSLWRLRRTASSPTALYRDPTNLELSENNLETRSVTITDPSDGLVNVDPTMLRSAELSYFVPDGSGTPAPSNTIGYLQVDLETDVPNNANLVDFQPIEAIPGDRLELELPNKAPITATEVDPNTDPVGANTGLLAATYYFAVPASLTTAHLVVMPGPVLATEAGLGQMSVEMTSGTSFSITLPPVPTALAQPAPPWTSARYVAVEPKSPRSAGHGSDNRLLIFLACLLVLLAVAFLIAYDHHKALKGRSSRHDEKSDPHLGDHLARDEQPSSTSEPAKDGQGVEELSVPNVRVLGPIRVEGWREKPERRVAEELLVYLALHQDRAHSAEEIAGAVFSLESGRDEVSTKTLRTYLSGLRQAIGAEHLPVASSGYELAGTATDWDQFRQLNAAAMAETGDIANDSRRRALSLVRGVPFAGVGSGRYSWAYAEPLVAEMTAAIVDCAHRLSSDLASAGDLDGAEQAARAGLRGAPGEHLLYSDLVAITRRRGDTSALRRLERELRRVLGADADSLLSDSDCAHLDPSDR